MAAEGATVVVVEGESDRVAVVTLARRLGHDLARVEVAVLGGATNAATVLTTLASAYDDLRVLGLYDDAEERWFRGALHRAGFGRVRDRDDLAALGFFACVRDLEDELIRALGAGRVQQVIEAQGELASLRTLQQQPAQRGRTAEEHLHRFIGVRAGRKALYARLLTEALDLDDAGVPPPLAALVAAL